MCREAHQLPSAAARLHIDVFESRSLEAKGSDSVPFLRPRRPATYLEGALAQDKLVVGAGQRHSSRAENGRGQLEDRTEARSRRDESSREG